MANENETHEEVCAEMRSFENQPPPMFAWRDLAERAEAAHKRELTAKKAELASVMGDFEKLLKKGNLLCVQRVKLEREIEKRNALIKGLVEILKITSKKYFECEERMCAFCGKKCGRNEATRLINEAREVVK